MKLKENLLGEIFARVFMQNKYSKSYINIKNVFELEKQEKFNMPNYLIKDFQVLEMKYNSFINNIPLLVIEKYFYENYDNLDKYIFIEFEGNEIQSIKVINLYFELENYYNELFALASKIANFYNIEVKINKNAINDKETIQEFI